MESEFPTNPPPFGIVMLVPGPNGIQPPNEETIHNLVSMLTSKLPPPPSPMETHDLLRVIRMHLAEAGTVCDHLVAATQQLPDLNDRLVQLYGRLLMIEEAIKASDERVCSLSDEDLTECPGPDPVIIAGETVLTDLIAGNRPDLPEKAVWAIPVHDDVEYVEADEICPVIVQDREMIATAVTEDGRVVPVTDVIASNDKFGTEADVRGFDDAQWEEALRMAKAAEAERVSSANQSDEAALVASEADEQGDAAWEEMFRKATTFQIDDTDEDDQTLNDAVGFARRLSTPPPMPPVRISETQVAAATLSDPMFGHFSIDEDLWFCQGEHLKHRELDPAFN